MAPATRRGPKKQVEHPRERAAPGSGRRWLGLAGATAAVALAAAGIAFVLGRGDAQAPAEQVAAAASGLPNTPDYHSLLVDAADPARLLLGTHAGLYSSADGGRTWQAAALSGQDAMNLVPAGNETVWAAGHNVLARSEDGGETWTDLRPAGLPSLDIHGFARDPRTPDVLLAAVAGEGLFRSEDGGVSFSLVSREVGPAVFGLALTPEGRILAGDVERGALLESADGGVSWEAVYELAVAGIAVNPADAKTIVAVGQGQLFSGLIVSRDGGASWTEALKIPGGGGPVAWAPSEPDVGYAVGYDRRLYRTDDRGASWRPVP